MAGLDPAIPRTGGAADGRVKPGHDEVHEVHEVPDWVSVRCEKRDREDRQQPIQPNRRIVHFDTLTAERIAHLPPQQIVRQMHGGVPPRIRRDHDRIAAA